MLLCWSLGENITLVFCFVEEYQGDQIEEHVGLIWHYVTLLFTSMVDIYEYEDNADWAKACRKHSALAFLLINHEDNSLLEYLEAGWGLDKLDQHIKHCGEHNSALQEDEIPVGIPEEHWW